MVLAVVGAMGFMLPASAGFAQAKPAAKSEGSVAASKADGVSGLVVVAPPQLHNRIPPHKRAAFDAEAANRQAWSNYRGTTATSSHPKGPGASPQPDNYPGLRYIGSH